MTVISEVRLLRLLTSLLALLLVSCSNPFSGEKRWYTDEQVKIGKGLFIQNCAVCHGSKAQGTPDWRKPLSDDSYPPPPLNGTAHTWHHPMRVLRLTIKKGGVPLGGKMPAFEEKLSDEEIDTILAFVQSTWSDEIYKRWAERNK